MFFFFFFFINYFAVMGSSQTKTNSIEATSQNPPPGSCCMSDNYLITITNSFIFGIQQSFATKYADASTFELFGIFPDSITHLIVSYIPLFYQIYGLRIDNNRITRLHSVEPILWTKHNIYINTSTILLKTINNQLLTLSVPKSLTFQLTKSEPYQSLLHELYDTDKCSPIKTIGTGICADDARNTAIVLQNGIVYYRPNENKNPTNNESTMTIKRISSLSSIGIISVSIGAEHTLLLSADGNVYAMGANDKGQCGLGYDYMNVANIAEPVLISELVDNDCRISSISCGAYHNCCIDGILGDLWRFGDNTYFQCSFDAFQCVVRPQRYIYQNKQVIKAECGPTMTIVLCCDGGCYGLGAPLFAIDNKTSKLMSRHMGEYNRCVWQVFKRDMVKVFKDMSIGTNHIVSISVMINDIYKHSMRIARLHAFNYKHGTFNCTELDLDIYEFDTFNLWTLVAGSDHAYLLLENK
eukprot:954549_1